MNDARTRADIVQRLRPRRPRPSKDNISSSSSSSSSIVGHLESVGFGEECPKVTRQYLTLSRKALQEMPWNVLLRIWLLRQQQQTQERSTTNDEEELDHGEQHSFPFLSRILVALRPEVLLFQSTAATGENQTDLMDVVVSDSTSMQGTTAALLDACWKRDRLLVFWKAHQRYHVLQYLKRQVNNRLDRSDQLCLLEIIQGIDQVTGVPTQEEDDVEDEATTLPLKVPEAFWEEQNDPQITPQRTTAENLHTTAEFQTWIRNEVHSWCDQSETEACLLQLYQSMGKDGSQGALYKAVEKSIYERSHNKESFESSLARQSQWVATILPFDTDEMILGKALCLDLLLSSGIIRLADLRPQNQQFDKWDKGVRIPTGSIIKNTSSSESTSQYETTLCTAIQDHLLVQPRIKGIPPNVKVLAIQLWNIALKSKNAFLSSSVVNTATKFQNWLPTRHIILPRFRDFLAECFDHGLDDSTTTTSIEGGLHGSDCLSSDSFAKDLRQELAKLHDMTTFALLGCCKDSFRAQVLDDNLLYHGIFLLLLNHWLLVRSLASCDSENKKPAMNARNAKIVRAMACLADLVERLTKIPGYLSVLQDIVAMLHFFMPEAEVSAWLSHSPNNSTDFVLVSTRDCCERLQRLVNDRRNVNANEICLLQLPQVLESLLCYSQNQTTDISHKLGGEVAGKLRRHWDIQQIGAVWISTLFDSLRKLHKRGLALLGCLERFHTSLMVEVGQHSKERRSLMGLLLSELDTCRNNCNDCLVAGMIIGMTPHQHVFSGSDRMEDLLPRCLALFDNFDRDSETVAHIMTAAAVRLCQVCKPEEISRNDIWKGCVLQARSYLSLAVPSARPESFKEWQEEVASSLATKQSAATAKNLWSEVCDGLMAPSTTTCNAISIEKRTPDQLEAPSSARATARKNKRLASSAFGQKMKHGKGVNSQDPAIADVDGNASMPYPERRRRRRLVDCVSQTGNGISPRITADNDEHDECKVIPGDRDDSLGVVIDGQGECGNDSDSSESGYEIMFFSL